tara:strand:+ start:973 stop:1167 length:195 start_codon:yes stop_codon:yes gene_type:complete
MSGFGLIVIIYVFWWVFKGQKIKDSWLYDDNLSSYEAEYKSEKFFWKAFWGFILITFFIALISG